MVEILTAVMPNLVTLINEFSLINSDNYIILFIIIMLVTGCEVLHANSMLLVCNNLAECQ